MRFFLCVIVFLLAVDFATSQEVVPPEKEILKKIPVGFGKSQVAYGVDEEGFYAPKGPLVDDSGKLIFFPDTTTDKIQIYANGDFFDAPIPGALPLSSMKNRQFSSQEGISSNSSGYQIIVRDGSYFYYNYFRKTNEYISYNADYITPFGVILYSDETKNGIATTFDVNNPSVNFAIVGQENLKAWLPTQPGGIRVGDDGLLYRGGLVWSAVKPIDGSPAERYIGRLASGHLVWFGGLQGQETGLVISNPQKTTELIVPLYGQGPSESHAPYMYSSSLGPWGELYCLLPPDNLWEVKTATYGKEYSIPKQSKAPMSAELVVVRNYLKYFGRLNDGGVRLRQDPSTTGEILGTYPAKTGFRILETGTTQETIGGLNNVWYKVRVLDGKEGWFFGSFVQNLYDGPNGKAPPWPNVPDW